MQATSGPAGADTKTATGSVPELALLAARNVTPLCVRQLKYGPDTWSHQSYKPSLSSSRRVWQPVEFGWCWGVGVGDGQVVLFQSPLKLYLFPPTPFLL